MAASSGWLAIASSTSNPDLEDATSVRLFPRGNRIEAARVVLDSSVSWLWVNDAGVATVDTHDRCVVLDPEGEVATIMDFEAEGPASAEGWIPGRHVDGAGDPIDSGFATVSGDWVGVGVGGQNNLWRVGDVAPSEDHLVVFSTNGAYGTPGATPLFRKGDAVTPQPRRGRCHPRCKDPLPDADSAWLLL